MNEGKMLWDFSGSIEFELGDLHYSLQRLDINGCCMRIGEIIVGVSYFDDTHNFEYRTGASGYGLFSQTVNNLGYSLQENGYGTNYSIKYWLTFVFPMQ